MRSIIQQSSALVFEYIVKIKQGLSYDLNIKFIIHKNNFKILISHLKTKLN